MESRVAFGCLRFGSAKGSGSRSCRWEPRSANARPTTTSLGACDKAGNSTAFIEPRLAALLTALHEASGTDQVGDQVSDQVAALLRVPSTKNLSAVACMDRLKLSHRPTFRANYPNPALADGLIERTIPDKPNSRLQKYRLTAKGKRLKG